MQVQTERGLIYVELIVETKEEAEKLGYSYSFFSKVANAYCYSKIVKLHSRVFCLVKKN